MTKQEERHRQQIEQLLNYPQVGPQSAKTIAMNLGTSEKEIQPILESLVAQGRISQMSDGRFVAHTGAGGGT